VAALVVAAAIVSIAPGTTGHTPSGDVLGATGGPRIAAFGGPLRGAAPPPAIGNTGIDRGFETTQASGSFEPDVARSGAGQTPAVVDATRLLRHYKVRSGDTLTSVAKHFHVKTATIWWANKLKSVDRLPVGRTLVVPPVDGLVVVVRAGETLASIAADKQIDSASIAEASHLWTNDVVVGQTLIVPGAKGAPLPAPKPKPAAKPAPKAAASTSVRVIAGGWVFPVVGGGAYISQYFHASHPAIDIAADYGTPVRAAHAGRVTFAGWKDNGGGWQVWISHGGGLYTTYNHMSSLSVSAGQSVGAGQRVGRIGQSGWATGPHCHFEVWRGPIWNGGVRVNPLNYV
jgi:murein DD-endopeptidase MepM/ murein hydrolase activator NlpD